MVAEKNFYIGMNVGRPDLVYLAANIDWATRKVRAHRVSVNMASDFCFEALEEAIAKYGTPEIFNSDQGSQFTSDDFTAVLKRHGISICFPAKAWWISTVCVLACIMRHTAAMAIMPPP